METTRLSHSDSARASEGKLRSWRFAPALFAAGVLLYVSSFFFPTVRIGLGYGSEALWSSAWSSLAVSVMALFALDLGPFLLSLYGLINILAVIVLALRVRGKAPVARCFCAMIAVGLIPFGWVAFIFMRVLRVETGYYLWLAGLLLMMVPEAVRGVMSDWAELRVHNHRTSRRMAAHFARPRFISAPRRRR